MASQSYLARIARVLTQGGGGGGAQINASSGDVANATAAATLAGTAGKTTYLTGFEITGTGATAGAAVAVTVTGVLNGPLTYIYTAATGAAVANTPLIVSFPEPLAASAANTGITVSCPALGAGNAHNSTNAHGYQL